MATVVNTPAPSAEEKAFAMLTDPQGLYVKKYGPGFEVKKKYVWHVIYM